MPLEGFRKLMEKLWDRAHLIEKSVGRISVRNRGLRLQHSTDPLTSLINYEVAK